MRAYRFGWYGDNDLGELLIQRILAGRKTATTCPAYDPEEAAVGETLRLVDKTGKTRGMIRITGSEVRRLGDFDEGTATRLGMTLEEIRANAAVANSREVRSDEEMRITYFELA
ncbi:MAG: ASCH domain-containing protein [Elusimicrobiota bacterium]